MYIGLPHWLFLMGFSFIDTAFWSAFLSQFFFIVSE